ncbi:hypothetical protein H5410_047506 [Solanum commersonii]|uniref:Gag-pol polyprotein n=1 Tax=Solanum commersonii TaxID=4109 RepID=A0A9J5XJB2_SOLCO|nr:hypothetical protein H5410_047506 [Solanum commersonii]
MASYQDQENSPNVFTGMLKEFSIDFYALLDPGASLSFMTFNVAMRFGISPKQLLEPHSVSTTVDTMDDLVELYIVDSNVILDINPAKQNSQQKSEPPPIDTNNNNIPKEDYHQNDKLKPTFAATVQTTLAATIASSTIDIQHGTHLDVGIAEGTTIFEPDTGIMNHQLPSFAIFRKSHSVMFGRSVEPAFFFVILVIFTALLPSVSEVVTEIRHHAAITAGRGLEHITPEHLDHSPSQMLVHIATKQKEKQEKMDGDATENNENWVSVATPSDQQHRCNSRIAFPSVTMHIEEQTHNSCREYLIVVDQFREKVAPNCISCSTIHSMPCSQHCNLIVIHTTLSL